MLTKIINALWGEYAPAPWAVEIVVDVDEMAVSCTEAVEMLADLIIAEPDPHQRECCLIVMEKLNSMGLGHRYSGKCHFAFNFQKNQVQVRATLDLPAADAAFPPEKSLPNPIPELCKGDQRFWARCALTPSGPLAPDDFNALPTASKHLYLLDACTEIEKFMDGAMALSSNTHGSVAMAIYLPLFLLCGLDSEEARKMLRDNPSPLALSVVNEPGRINLPVIVSTLETIMDSFSFTPAAIQHLKTFVSTLRKMVESPAKHFEVVIDYRAYFITFIEDAPRGHANAK